MKKLLKLLLLLGFTCQIQAQKSKNDLKLISEYGSENKELNDILRFEGINYLKLKFVGKELTNKSYKLYVKEIWDGKIVNDAVVFNSEKIGVKRLQKVNDSVLKLKVISKLTSKKKLKLNFKFPRFGITKEYKAIDSDLYSLRNMVDESKMEISYNKKFYLLAYILPYERSDGSKSWCEVGTNGKDIENWGKKFGIKHYLIFEMKFE
ncbi:hypothetical protein ACSIGC_09875 [Tenacibaculum sp. ZS6-P6]|uniref:hypothetical protein n=1 Tax=Tenacibaculum sp. ZS6-P6 TaxID=3447503 RepID=UPI003F993670